ncbi:MAG: hypothetical protein LBH18_05590 [Spirochaetaceae bacterium]|nr:hypothetical protein [Spirochaetaceae bacterium]
MEIEKAFLFACYTGLHVSDLETITCGQIETNPMQIIKRQVKTQEASFNSVSLMPSFSANRENHKFQFFECMSGLFESYRHFSVIRTICHIDIAGCSYEKLNT